MKRLTLEEYIKTYPHDFQRDEPHAHDNFQWFDLELLLGECLESLDRMLLDHGLEVERVDGGTGATVFRIVRQQTD